MNTEDFLTQDDLNEYLAIYAQEIEDGDVVGLMDDASNLKSGFERGLRLAMIHYEPEIAALRREIETLKS